MTKKYLVLIAVLILIVPTIYYVSAVQYYSTPCSRTSALVSVSDSRYTKSVPPYDYSQTYIFSFPLPWTGISLASADKGSGKLKVLAGRIEEYGWNTADALVWNVVGVKAWTTMTISYQYYVKGHVRVDGSAVANYSLYIRVYKQGGSEIGKRTLADGYWDSGVDSDFLKTGKGSWDLDMPRESDGWYNVEAHLVAKASATGTGASWMDIWNAETWYGKIDMLIEYWPITHCQCTLNYLCPCYPGPSTCGYTKTCNCLAGAYWPGNCPCGVVCRDYTCGTKQCGQGRSCCQWCHN